MSELIENGVKYGNFAGGLGKVEVDIRREESIITMEVINPVNLTDQDARNHMRRLDKTIQWDPRVSGPI